LVIAAMSDGNDSAPDLSSSETRSVRLFVALKIHEAVARDLAAVARELGDPAVRPVAVADIHLTLVPPWTEQSPSKAIDTLASVAGRFGPFALAIEHVGYGPHRREPRLLWADCAATEELSALRQALLTAFGQRDDRPFRPHITLVRIRGNGRAVARRHPLDRPLALQQQINSVELFQSPAPGERGYKVLASAVLSSQALQQ
jgi:2'-5' RNA ligase